MLRRRALDRIGFRDAAIERLCWFDESFRQSEDVECWLRLKAAGCSFGYVDEPLTLYRVNNGGLSANIAAQLDTWRRFRDKVAVYAPEIVANHGARAEAYQLRYLARRAVRSNDRFSALRLMVQAVALCPRLLLEEPVRTLSTIGAALAKCGLPAGVFRCVERAALKTAAAAPSLRL